MPGRGVTRLSARATLGKQTFPTFAYKTWRSSRLHQKQKVGSAGSPPSWGNFTPYTVEPRYNEPLYNEVLVIAINLTQ